MRLLVLAQISNPNPSCRGVPGCERSKEILDVLAMFGLVAATAGIIIGVAVWALSSRTGHAGGAGGGRVAVMASVLAAMIIGIAGTIVSFGFGFLR